MRRLLASSGAGAPMGFVAGTLAVIVVGCSSNGGSGFTDSGVDDSGTPVDSSVADSGDSGSKPDTGVLFDSGGGNDATTTADAQGDANFEFDGFAKSDGNNCFDDDGDGFTTCDGDCNDHDSQINPCAFDTNDPNDPVGHDGIDNDCDGQIDNLRLCDSSLTASHDTTAAHYASAMDICDNPKCPTVIGATFYGPNNQYAHRITKHMGNNFTPHKGTYMAFLSTGTADDDIDTASYTPGDGTNLQNTFTHPSPLLANQNVNPCGTGQNEPTTVNDYSELRLTLRAPINAGSFTFDFNFFSEEYPEYVCHGFNDTFLAMLTSKQYTTPTQIAFDANNHRINVNNSFFQDCQSVTSTQPSNLGYVHTCTGALSLLTKSGYELKYGQTAFTLGNGNWGSGATDWLKTTAPVAPGETFTLSFIIFDEGDGLMDSAINLDNFRWHSTTLSSPVTAR
jgi:hypothetical protein